MAVDLDFERSIYSHQQACAGPLFALPPTFAEGVLARVDDVIQGRTALQALSEERQFLAHLRPHQGKARTVALGELAEKMKVSPRAIKMTVQNLRLMFRVQICASREGNDGGYYLASSYEECIAAAQPMMSQAISMLRVVAAMRGGRDEIDVMLTQIGLALTQVDQHSAGEGKMLAEMGGAR